MASRFQVDSHERLPATSTTPPENRRTGKVTHRAISCNGPGTPGEGLRRTEAARLDIADWGRNPAAPQFGRYGTLHVRYGKAKRGQPPRRRNVASVMAWAVEAVEDYVDNIRPRFGCEDHPGVVGDRARWADQAAGDQRPVRSLSRCLNLPKALTPHSFRHSYVSHLTENGVDRRFIQVQVGHECDSSTAIYTHVSDDFMNTMLKKALSPVFDPPAPLDKEP